MLLLALALTSPALPQFEQTRLVGGAVKTADAPIVADVDGDGRDDMVVLGDDLNSLFWASGSEVANADPSKLQFRLLVPLDAVGQFSQYSARGRFADLDRDGDLDLVLPGANLGQAIAVYTNVDGSSFAPAVTYPGLGSGLSDVTIEDLDGDGFEEIVVSRRGPNAADLPYVHWNNAGTLAAPVLLLSGTTGERCTATRFADINADGFTDLVMPNTQMSSGGLGTRVVFGTGASTFDITNSTEVPVELSALQIEDIDGNGFVDLVGIATASDDAIRIWSNTGAYPFGLPTPVAFGAPGTYRNVTAVDIDADGDIDLVTAFDPGGSSDAYRVFGNDGSGGFSVLQEGAAPGRGDQTAVAVGDPNGDGLLDLFVTAFELGYSMFYVPASQGSVRFPEAFRAGERFGFGPVSTFDANADGHLDLIVVGQFGGSVPSGVVAVKLANGDGTYAAATPVSESARRNRRTAGGDVDGDGISDVVSVSRTSVTRLVLHTGLGDGTFEQAAITAPVPGMFTETLQLSTHDFDGDGSDDVLHVLEFGFGVQISFGDPVAPFTDNLVVTTMDPAQTRVTPFDIDRDGDLDLLYAGAAGGVEWSENLGSRAFAARAPFAPIGTGFQSQAVLVADLDRNGLEDLWVPPAGAFYQTSAGTFTGAQPLENPFAPWTGEMSFIDVDLDGDLDLVATRFGSSFTPTRLAENLGGYQWANQQDIGWNVGSVGTVIAEGQFVDLDGDGDIDVIGGSFEEQLIIADNSTLGLVGARYCGPPTPNSTGTAGKVQAVGSTSLAVGRLQLRASSLPPGALGFFITSRVQGDVTGIPGSMGRLCLGGAIGRFVGAGQVMSADAAGGFRLEIDLDAMPKPSPGFIAVQPGETWSFQAWHRDAVGGAATANFTTATAVQF